MQCVTEAQAQENRDRIVETASTLFRERGYDGVGVAELMATAGFTHGGFYKHFRSKADLMDEAAACGISQNLTSNTGLDPAAFVEQYLSRGHRDSRSSGCTIAALSGDTARQPADIKATFADGIENTIASFQGQSAKESELDQTQRRATMISTYAHVVGALILSRACPDDSPLADEILDVCRKEILREQHDR